MPVLGERLGNTGRPTSASHALGALVEAVSGEHLGNIYRMVLAATGNVFQLLLTLFMLITLFFVYKDGNRMAAQLDAGRTHPAARWQRFSRVVPATINSTVTGMGLIALGEGAGRGLRRGRAVAGAAGRGDRLHGADPRRRAAVLHAGVAGTWSVPATWSPASR